MQHDFAPDIAAIASIKAIPTMLDIVCRITGMRFAAVARVTERRWIACAVRDNIAFGLEPGGELPVETTLCHEIRQSGEAIVIDNVAQDASYAGHHTPKLYGLQSYISVPIRMPDGAIFDTLCAIDTVPRRLDTPDTMRMFEMFAEIIGFHLAAIDRLSVSEAGWLNERNAAQLREQFIAVLGHDLRNPLGAISAGMRLLLNTPLNQRATTVVGHIQNSVARMAGLIDNVMDFARFRLGGGITLQSAPIDIEPILRQVVQELQLGAPDRAIETHFDLHGPVRCDRGRLGQLASNLIANALAHGAADSPVRLSATASDGVFELSIANQGPPIPPAILETIFQPFSRGALRPGLEGLGLGLYICNEIAQAHGGELGVVSGPAETRFAFRMPL